MVFIHNINPVLISLGPLDIRYYGLIYVLGFLFAYYLLSLFAKRKMLDFTKDEIADFFVYMLLGTLIGARLIYALVYNAGYYFSNPLEILYLWQGGLSFHGGLLGAFFAGYLFWKKKKFDFWHVADLTIIPLALGLGFGRIANFINGELYGRITSLPWGVKFQGVDDFRHPSQLYEAGKNFLIFATLWILKDKKQPKGFLFWTFVTMYGLLRFSIEFLRQPDPQLGFVFWKFSMGQLLSFPMFLLGLGMLIYLKRKALETKYF